MKTLLFVLGFFCAAGTSYGQISIGSTKVDTNAVLTLASESKGLRLPTLSLGAEQALATNRGLSGGMFAYNTTSQQLNFYNGNEWIGFEANSETGNFSSHRHSIMVSYDSSQATAFYTDNAGMGHFVRQPLDAGSIVSLSSRHQVLLCGGSTAWVFNVNYAGVGAWTAYPLAGPVSSLANDELIVLYRSGMAYGLSQDTVGNPVWMPQTTGGGALLSIASKKQVVIYRNGSAFGFSRSSVGLCSWRKTSIRGTVEFSRASHGQILLANANDAYVFAGDATGGGAWYSATLSGVSGTISTQD